MVIDDGCMLKAHVYWQAPPPWDTHGVLVHVRVGGWEVRACVQLCSGWPLTCWLRGFTMSSSVLSCLRVRWQEQASLDVGSVLTQARCDHCWDAEWRPSCLALLLG